MYIPKQFRPGSDRETNGNIFVDLKKTDQDVLTVKNKKAIGNLLRTGDCRMESVNPEQVEKTCCKVKLDIACGKNKKTGFTGVDIWEGADIVANLEEFPWPFEDNSVDEIFCSHYIEHTPDLVSFANELYRILKIDGKAEIIAPYYSSIRAWQDPTHLRAISENTYLYFSKDWRVINRLDHYPIVADFDFESSYVIDPAWQDKSDDELKFAIKHYINVVSDIRTILTKRRSYGEDVERDLRRAEEFWEAGNLWKATEICHTIISRGVENHEIYLMLAEYACQNGEANDAVSYFSHALLLDDESVQAHAGLFRALTQTGRTGDAESHLKNLQAKKPDIAGLIAGFIEETVG